MIPRHRHKNITAELSRRAAYGPNLATNGFFADGLSAWDNLSTGTAVLSLSDGALVLARVGSTDISIAGQAVDTITGETYCINISYEADATATARIIIGTSSSDADIAIFNLSAASTVDYVITFRAISASTYIRILPHSSTTTGVLVSKVSVRSSQNLIANGELNRDTEWTKGTEWTIGSGVAYCDGSQTGSSPFYQPTTNAIIGEKRLVKFTVSGYSAGNIRGLSGGAGGAYVAANGTYSQVIAAVTTSSNVGVQADVNFIGSIDNVEVYEWGY